MHGGHQPLAHGETSEALYLTSGFSYERAEDAEARFAETQQGYTYSRVGNPTVRMLEERMALLEGAEDCAATASGMAAVHAALMCQLRAGMRVVGAALLFGSCHWILTQLCPRFGVEVELVDGKDLDAWALALGRAGPISCSSRSPGNPDARAGRHRRGRRAGAPGRRQGDRRQRVRDADAAAPLELGADLVVYSGTKHIDGQGRCLGGLICATADFRKTCCIPICAIPARR